MTNALGGLVGYDQNERAIAALVRVAVALEEIRDRMPPPDLTARTVLECLTCRLQYADEETGYADHGTGPSNADPHSHPFIVNKRIVHPGTAQS